MTYLPENVWVEILTIVDGLPTWTNIGGDIVSPIKVNLGFSDGDVLSRLAPGADMRFDLENINSAYDPSSTFYKGQKIRLRIKYGSLVKVKFFGYIDHISLDPGTWGTRQAHVVCIDWLGLAAKTPIRALVGITNATIDTALTALLTQMQIQPEALDVEAGEIIMPTVFDQVDKAATVYSELQNLVMGEWGYVYMRDGGMTLKVENSMSRTGDGSDYQTIPYYLNDGVATELLLEDDTNFLLEDNTNLLLEGEPTSGSFDSNFGQEYTNLSINHGDNLVNKISATVTPTIVGGAAAVIYPFSIASGSKAILVPPNTANTPFLLSGQYKDPTAGGAQISASSVITPVVATDWTFNSKADGTGTDLSANLTISFTAGQSGFKASLVNSGTAGYITKFNVRGTPVYRYNPIETVYQDQRSIWDYGDYSLEFTRQYGGSNDDIMPFMFRLLLRDRKPRTIFGNPKFTAYDDVDHLVGFLGLDIGDQIRLTSTKPANDALYYIQGVKFTIQPGSEQITFDYVTTETLAGDPVGITQIAVEQADATQYIEFGYLPIISNLTQRTICARFKVPSVTGNYILRWYLSPAIQNYIYLASSVGGNMRFEFDVQWSTTPLSCRADDPAASPPLNQWINLAIIYDSSSTANRPVFYEDAVLRTTSTTSAPVGTLVSESGSLFQVTCNGSALGEVAQIEDVAIYDRFLTAAEITAIHGAGSRVPFASYPKVGLKFFFGGIDDETYTARLDGTLGSLDTVYDLQNGFTGQPIGGPTLRVVG